MKEKSGSYTSKDTELILGFVLVLLATNTQLFELGKTRPNEQLNPN